MFLSRFIAPRSRLHAYQVSKGGVFRRTASSIAATERRKRNAVKIAITDNGEILDAVWDSSVTPSSYHSVWLRHNCQCPQCRAYNQTTLISYELDPKIAISEARVTEDSEDVQIKWSCGHVGHLNLDWLRRHCYSPHSLEKARKNSEPPPVTKNILPAMDSRELEDDQGVWRWLKILNEHGLCLLTGVPCTEEGGLKISQAIAPHVQMTFYGGVDKVKVVENPINVAYAPRPIEPHMDIPMYESHPGIILLHCLRNDECVIGGESILIDALAVVEKLRITHPHHFSTLVRVPATFQRIHFERDYPVNMIYRTPHIHLNGHGQIVKLRWSPHNDGPLQAAEEDVKPYYEAYSCLAKSFHNDTEFQIHHKLQPGDMLSLNDHRMLHGRSTINLNGGVRLLNYFAMSIDEFKSRLMVLCAQFDPDYQPKNILNHDFSFSTAAQV